MIGRWKVGVIAACVACAAAFACGGSDSTTQPDAATSDASTCSQGTLACGATCVDPQTDPKNCGSCGNACGSTDVCASGQCRSTCLANQSKCDTDAGAYCANMQTDNANCGACGHACDVGQVCSSSKCGSTCDTGQALCKPDGGAAYCATTDTDNANCGACGKACGLGQVCSGGQCGSTCTSAQTLCVPGSDAGADASAGDSGAPYCANLQADNDNCGACGVVCSAGQTCVSGACKVSCATNLTACGNSCVDTMTDSNHCGSCGNACGSGQTCHAGTCGELVAYWPFDPLGSGADVTGHGYDATNNGATASTGYGRDGFTLNGTTQDLSAPNLDSVLTVGSFTVEAWIYQASVPSNDNPIVVSCTASTDHCLHLTVRAGKPYFGFGNDDLPSTTALASTTWYHLAFTYDATTKQQSIFLNGVADSNRTAQSAYLGSGQPTLIGGAPTAWQTNGFNGVLDEVKVYNYARAPADILDDASALVKLPFDGTIFDDGPNHLWTSATAATFVTGEHGQAAAFDGTSTMVQAWYMVPFGNANQPFSLEAWINPTTNTDAVIFYASTAQNGGGSCVPYLGFYNGQLVAHVWNGSGDVVVTAPTTPSTGVWTHVAQTWSAATGVKLYVGGTMVASAAAPSNPTFAEQYLTLGSTAGASCGGSSRPTGLYKGALDDVRVYNRVRTVSEIASDATP